MHVIRRKKVNTMYRVTAAGVRAKSDCIPTNQQYHYSLTMPPGYSAVVAQMTGRPTVQLHVGPTAIMRSLVRLTAL